MVSSEVAPFAKTGGLADVVGSLPCALKALGHDVAVLMPRYASVETPAARRVYDGLPMHFGPRRVDATLFRVDAEAPVYLVDCPELFSRPGLYGEGGVDYPDNDLRFAVLARAALALARRVFRTEIFHCHDWQAGLIPAYLKTTFANDPTFLGTKTLFTIHNLGYQGLFPPSTLSKVALDRSVFRSDGLEFFGSVSYLKSGIAFSDALNTVSPTYAAEIQMPEYGFGLDGILRARSGALSGILNGADYGEWNPATDPHIPARYGPDALGGKAVCKRRLVEEFGLPAGAMARPLLGVVSRFTRQKGSDLIAAAMREILAEDAYFVALGSGEPEYEERFARIAAEFPGRAAVKIGFDNGLAHRIEAGSDIFLMPSHYEPCGLNQMYSLKYGTIPVVRATGGLDDTIDESTGFKFRDYSASALLQTVRDAIGTFSNPVKWRGMMLNGMARDFSWNMSAAAYSALYRDLLRSGESDGARRDLME
jgi:starch synthase